MRKKMVIIGTLASSAFLFAQKGPQVVDQDTLRIQEIEDVELHRSGNPNKARVVTAKSNLSVMENPQPISIVTHEIIEQQQAKQLSEVLQNVNGLYVTSARGGSQDSFGGRGFVFGNENMFKNGARINSGVFPEVNGLERVEVLKGANAMLFGNVAAGGVINLITKKPRFNFGGTAGFNVGSWNNYKPFVDVYGPLSKKVAFRLNSSYENTDSFRDIVESEKFYVNPSLAFNIKEHTQLIVEGDYLQHHFTPDFGIGAIENADQTFSLNKFLPREAFVGADWQYQDVKQATTNITLNHQINKEWTLNSVLSYQNFTRDYFSTERIVWHFDDSNRLFWNRPLNRTYNEQNYASAQVNINGEFKTGQINHKILFGTDGDFGSADAYAFLNPDNGKEYGRTSYYGTDGDPSGILYLDDPSTWSTGAMPNATKNKRTRVKTQRFGLYAQDFIEISEKFKILAGLRWSFIENGSFDKNYYQYADEKRTSNTVDRAFSPKGGLIYMPNKNLSIFATYTNSFASNSGVDYITEKALRPSIIDQYEVGMKKNFWNNTVAINLTAYQIINRNFYQTAGFLADGVTPNVDSNKKEFAGRMKSEGVELDITGNPNKNLSIIAGASYNHSVFTDTPDDFGYVENQRIARTPATTANLSVFYTFTEKLNGLKTGLSVYYIGDRIAGWNDTKTGSNSLEARNGASRLLDVEDYTTVAFSLGYDAKRFSILGKLGNLFDVNAYTYHENYSVNPIAPRNYYLTFTYKF